MQPIEVHRAAIGNFYLRCKSGGRRREAQKYSEPNNELTGLPTLIIFTLLFYVVILFHFSNLHIGDFNFAQLVAEGIESNPGPTTPTGVASNIKKYVFGSCHQGHAKFGDTAGIQCTSNAYLSICFSLIKKVSTWKSFDLDYILDQGDKLFKQTGSIQALAVE